MPDDILFEALSGNKESGKKKAGESGALLKAGPGSPSDRLIRVPDDLPFQARLKRRLERTFFLTIGQAVFATIIAGVLVLAAAVVGYKVGKRCPEAFDKISLDTLELAGTTRPLEMFNLRRFPDHPAACVYFSLPSVEPLNQQAYEDFLRRLWTERKVRGVSLLTQDKKSYYIAVYAFRGHFLGGPGEVEEVKKLIQEVEDPYGKHVAEKVIQVSQKIPENHPLAKITDPG